MTPGELVSWSRVAHDLVADNLYNRFYWLMIGMGGWGLCEAVEWMFFGLMVFKGLITLVAVEVYLIHNPMIRRKRSYDVDARRRAEPVLVEVLKTMRALRETSI